MEKLVKGDIVVISFPFSDLSSSKRRPALVMAAGDNGETILCQITSNPSKNDSIRIQNDDFAAGRLGLTSFARVRKLFTADVSIIEYKIGSLKEMKVNEVVEKLCSILRS